MRPGYFPPIYSSSVYCPTQMWNGTTMNPWYMYSPFVYPGWGAPPFYSFWSIDQMVMAEKDTIQNDIYTLMLYWMISILKKPVTYIRLSSYAFGLSTFTKRQGAYVEHQNEPHGRSAVVAWTVHACTESVRVPSFSRDLLPKTAGLTRETVWSGSRPPPLYRWRATADWTPRFLVGAAVTLRALRDKAGCISYMRQRRQHI
jgi:hypothetical protein